MISCTEFIPAYSELFRYLEERQGKTAVLDFSEYLSDIFLTSLKESVTVNGIRGCWIYWSKTLEEEAPDFTMKDQDQNDVKLSDFKGKKNVVLAFYPLDWSPVCTGENKCLTDDFPNFESANAEVFGVSTDSFFSHKAWADALELKHRLLADMHLLQAPARGR